MGKFRGFKAVSGMLVLAGAGLLAGCSSEDGLGGVGCSGEIEADVQALQTSVNALVELAGSLRVDLATACKNIAEAGGETVTVSANPDDEEVEAVCAQAEAAITAELSAAGTVTLSIQPAECRIDASAQLACEGECKADVSCEEPDISVRCQGGEVSVQCEGTCEGTATCEGSATVAANCEGTCNATCEGDCSGDCKGECDSTCSATNGDGSCNGQCNGTCNGQCTGTCSGTCTGKCELAANANVTCNAEARCEGECTGTATAPTCSGEVTPPTCEGDAECNASCEGSAQFEAECSPPSVKLEFSGTVDATFLATLEANLSVIHGVIAKGELVVDTAGEIVSSFTGIVESSATCAASLAGEIQAAAEASVSVQASVSVSASASGSASGGT